MKIIRKIESIEKMVGVNYRILNKDLMEVRRTCNTLKERIAKLEEDNFSLVNENNSLVAENNELKEQLKKLVKPKRKYVRKATKEEK